jgi:MFS family permease
MRRLRILQPLRERDFALYMLGSIVTLIGDGFFLVAIAWQVYDLWNVPTALAIVGVAETVPLVAFLLFAGVVIDRIERRWVMFWASVGRGAAVGLLALLTLAGAVELWHIFAIALVYGAGRAFEGPASGAIIPDLVPASQLVQANSLSMLIRPLAFRLIGPAVGGFVVHELGTGAAFLADAASFAFAAGVLTLLRPRMAALQRKDGHASMMADIREGLRFVRGHVWLWGTIVWALFAALLAVGPFVVLVPYVVKNELGGDAGDLGLVFAAGGLGAILSSALVGQVGLPRRHMTFMYFLWAVAFFDMVLYTVAQVPWHAMVIALYAEACWGAGLIVWVTLMQRVVPTELLGRVKSVDWLVSSGFTPISFALTGPAAAWLGAEPVLIIGGLGGMVLTVGFYFLPGMRDTEREEHPSRVLLSEPEQPELSEETLAARTTAV